MNKIYLVIYNQVYNGAVLSLNCKAYPSYDNAKSFFDAFVSSEKEILTKKGWVEDEDNDENTFEMYVDGEHCLNHTSVRIIEQEISSKEEIKPLIGYQVVEIDDETSCSHESFVVFKTKETAEKLITDILEDEMMSEYTTIEIYEGDVEEPTILNSIDGYRLTK